MIGRVFLLSVADEFGNTTSGLTGNDIAKYCRAYAQEFGIEIPYPEYPFPMGMNKRTALHKNLLAFSPEQQFKIIKELSELPKFKENEKIKDIKIKLFTDYSNLNHTAINNTLNKELVDEVVSLLFEYPEADKAFKEAITMHTAKIFQRNLLDNLRLALELLLKTILQNNKSLENQSLYIGQILKKKKVSSELVNMFNKLIDYYTKYQNTYIKHSHAVPEAEVDIIFELTSSFMKFIIQSK